MRSRSRTAIDSRDVAALRAPARRTLALRILFAGGAILLLAGAWLTARDLDPRDRGLLPTGTAGVIVLDVSLSILDDHSGVVRRTMQQLVDADAPVGLVVFSDVPYELFPPGTPASELRPLIRMLAPVGDGPAVTPWTDTFRSGTRISSALRLAHDMLEGDGVANGSILLISDLETAPDDVPATAQLLREITRKRVPIRLLALGPSSDARTLFGSALGPEAFTPIADGPARGPEPPEARRRPLPWVLLAFGALFLLALAGHERYAGRLALPARPRSKAVA